MCFLNTSQIQPVVVWNQERSETQLHTVSVSVATKMLGFTRFLFDVTLMKQVHFSIVFQGFGGIRSTQPTMLASKYKRLIISKVREPRRYTAETTPRSLSGTPHRHQNVHLRVLRHRQA